MEKLHLHLLWGSHNHLIRVGTGAPGLHRREMGLCGKWPRQDPNPRLAMIPYLPCSLVPERGRRMTVGWMGQQLVFLEFKPRSLCESWSVPAFPLATGWQCGGRKGRFPVPSGSAGPGQMRNFRQNRAATYRAVPLLTASAMTLISHIHSP